MNIAKTPFRTNRIMAAVLFFALAVWEAYFDLNGIVRAGFLPRANIVGWVIVPLFALAGTVLLLPRSIPWRPHVVAIGIIGCLMHGAFLRVGRATTSGPSGGALFIVAALALVLLMAPIIRDWLATRGLVSPGKMSRA